MDVLLLPREWFLKEGGTAAATAAYKYIEVKSKRKSPPPPAAPFSLGSLRPGTSGRRRFPPSGVEVDASYQKVQSVQARGVARPGKMTTSSGNAAFILLFSAYCLATLACDLNGAKFGYVGSMGPDHWGSLNPNFTRCAMGTNQSPIDIATGEAVYDPSMQPLHRNYTVANATIVDNVFNVALRMEDAAAAAGSVNVDGKQYRLKQLHWHSPSEHTVNGKRFPVELHMVHSSDDGNITVVAILYRFGRPDPFLRQIQDKLAALYAEGCDAEKGAPVPAGFVNLWSLRRHAYMYYRYVGSFTTPPCTENVVWNILAQVREMTLDQAAALKAPLEEAYRHNNRPTQPMNGRTVRLYHRLWKKNKRSP